MDAREKLLITTYQEVNDLFRSNTRCDDENVRDGGNTNLPEQHFSSNFKMKIWETVELLTQKEWTTVVILNDADEVLKWHEKDLRDDDALHCDLFVYSETIFEEHKCIMS